MLLHAHLEPRLIGTAFPPDVYLQGEGVMRLEVRIPFRGWRITSFTTYTSVRERVNSVIALEIMGICHFVSTDLFTH